MSADVSVFDASRVRVISTGFGPFLDNPTNPSWEVAQAFSEVAGLRFPSECERLAVTYEEAQRFVEQVDHDAGDLIVVHFGLSTKRDHVALERFAHNCRGPTRDETGRQGWPDYVVSGGPLALQTHLPLRTLAAELELLVKGEIGMRACVSRDAGEYVCNAIYYHSLSAACAARQRGCAADALFVHVPRLDNHQAKVVGQQFGRLFCALI